MALSGIREKMNQNQKPFIIGGIVIVCVAIALVIWEVKPASAPPPPSSAYFYDTSNGNIVVKPADSIPPLKGADGKETLVLAKFFTCTTCGDKKIGYLMKYTPQAKEAAAFLAQPTSAGMTPQQAMQKARSIPQYQMAVAQGTLVRLPAKGSRWYAFMGPMGARITTPPRCSATALAKACLP